MDFLAFLHSYDPFTCSDEAYETFAERNPSIVPFYQEGYDSTARDMLSSEELLRLAEVMAEADERALADAVRKGDYSSNMYQIFTYVKNKETELADRPHEVSGMLLYAKTDEDIYPENEYRMSGNKIEVRTLNLDRDFAMIKAQLDGIAEKYLGVKAA